MRGLTKSFGDQRVLRGVDLEVPAGSITVIIGRSGGGKSVFLKHLLGLLRPDQGEVRVAGVDVGRLSGRALEQVRARYGVVFQGGALFDSMTCFDNVAFPLREKTRLPRRDIADRVRRALEQVGLTDVDHKYPAEVSGGMRKRVAIARALVTEPDIIFFDEPTTGLDPIMADVINDLIVEITRKLGATAVSITHDIASVRKIADKVAMIYDGRIIWAGSIEEMDHSGNEYVEQFIHGRAQGPIKMQVRRL